MISIPPELKTRFEDLFGIDVRSLRLLRISLGVLLIADLCMRARNLRAHYTDAGIFPRAAAIENFGGQPGRWSLHLLGGSVGFEAAMFVLAGLFALMLIAGYRTRLATLLSWALLVSLHMRMPSVLNGSDFLLRMLLFWSIFLPAERASSPTRVISVASAALLVQVATVYFVAGYAKSNPVWLRGDGLLIAFSHFGSPLGRRLLNWPDMLRFVSMTVPWLEVIGALLLFWPFRTPRVRLVVVLVFVGFHAGIGLTMSDLGLFPFTCMVSWAIFLPTFAWDRIASFCTVRAPWLVGRLARLAPERAQAPLQHAPSGVSSRFVGGLALLLLVYAALGNLDALQRYVLRRNVRVLPARLAWIANAGLLQQNWRFFSSPTTAWTWFIFQMNLEDGRSIDMLTGAPPVFDESSRLASQRELIPDHHWFDHYRELVDPTRPQLKYTLDYYCQAWNAAHPPSERARSITAHLGIQLTYPATHEVGWRKDRLQRDCPRAPLPVAH